VGGGNNNQFRILAGGRQVCGGLQRKRPVAQELGNPVVNDGRFPPVDACNPFPVDIDRRNGMMLRKQNSI
jgi:hypothetical protein